MAGGAEVGAAHVSIFPVMTGFRSQVSKEMQESGKTGMSLFSKAFNGKKVGNDVGKDVKTAFDTQTDGLGDAGFKKLTSEASKAAQQLAQARQKQQSAAAAVEVAEQKLVEAIAKNGENSSQAIAAQARLAAAQEKSEQATDQLTSATERLTTARKQVLDVAAKSGDSGLEWLQRETETATNAMEAAKQRLANANNSVAKAEANLQKVIAETGADSDKAAQAQTRLIAAKQRQESASTKLRDAENRLEAAQGQLAQAAKQAGDAMEKESGSGNIFANGLETAANAVDTVKNKVKDFAGSIGGMLAGAGIGTAFAAAISSGLDQANLSGTLKAKLGDTTAAREAAQIAGSVYAQGWGESLDEVSNATTVLMQQLGQVDKSADFTSLTSQAMALAGVFEQDVGGMAAAAGQMIKTGMVDNAQQAFDVLTVGFQSGANMADDLLDTFTEYPAQFQKLGIDGQTAMGLISQGLQAGARNADLVADAIKEFSIRAVDGSDTTKAGFEALGLSADDMAAKFGQGGQTASDAFALVLEKLNGIEDPVERSAAAVNLFGTQAEDLGNALYALDPSTAVSALGQIDGAAQQAAGNSQNLEMTWQQFVRQLTSSAGAELVPAIEQVTDLVAQNSDAIGSTVSNLVGVVGDLVTAFVNMPAPMQTAVAGLALFGGKIGGVVSTIGTVAKGIGTFAQSTGVVSKVMPLLSGAVNAGATAFKGLTAAMAANPIGAVVVAITALVAALVWFFTQTETGRQLWAQFTEFLSNAWQGVVDFFTSTGQSIASFFTETLPQAFQGIGEWFTNLPSMIGEALTGLVTQVGEWAVGFAQSAMQAGQQFVQNLVQFITTLPETVAYWLAYVITFVVVWVAEMAAKAVEAGTQFVQNVIQFIQNLPSNVANFLTNVITNVVNWVTQMANNARNAGQQFLNNVVQFITQLPGRIASFLQNVISNVTGWASNMASKAQQAGQQFLNNVVQFITQLPGRVQSFLSNVISSVGNFASQMAQGALRSGQQFLSNLVNTLASIPGRMVSIGTQIVQGIVNGITGSIGRVGSAILGGVNDAIAKVKGMLGIHSPSRYFRDKIGAMIGQGLALGVDDENRTVGRSMQGLAETVAGQGFALADPTAPAAAATTLPAPAAATTGETNGADQLTRIIAQAILMAASQMDGVRLKVDLRTLAMVLAPLIDSEQGRAQAGL